MPAKAKRAKSKKPRPERAKLHPISEEMRQWSALLEAEILTWPKAIAKPMFGFRAFYRAKTMFAAVPHTREFDPRGSLIMKFDPMPPALSAQAEADTRIGSWSREYGRGWFTFTLRSADELRDAIWWLQQAHQAAARAKRS